ncbi:MAG: hypothetical protein MK005_10165 [Alcanivorax sp.]|nr:hypothetical protein [Alcanivorax sp.]
MTLSTIVVVLPAPECREADRHFTLAATLGQHALMRFVYRFCGHRSARPGVRFLIFSACA